MAEPKFEDVEAWLIENEDKKGTPDYVQMSSAYKALDPQRTPSTAPATAPAQSESFWDRVKLGFGIIPGEQPAFNVNPLGLNTAAPPPGTPEPEAIDLNTLMTAKRLTSDPRSLSNRADRVLASAIGGVPDLGISVYNAGSRMIGSPESQAAYLTPKMLANAGVPDLPADAPWYERLGEAGASAFLGGGAGAAGNILNTARATSTAARAALPAGSTAAAINATAVPAGSTAVRMAVPTVVPTMAGHYGGELGAILGEKYLGDRETGALLGSLLGGSAHALGPAARNLVHQKYAPQGAPDAREIFATANRQGVTPTAGMLGDDAIRRREQVYSGMPGSANVVQDARSNARAQIGDAYSQAAEARGSLDMDPTPGTIGTRVSQAASETAESLRAASEARQVALMDRVGADTPVDVSPVFERGYDMMTDPRARLTPSQRRDIDYRLTEQLAPLVTRNAGGDPVAPGIGHNAGPPLEPPTAGTAPYGYVSGFRTELGQDINTPAGGRAPPVAALYPPTTDVMRDTARNQGVSPQNFNTVMDRTRAVERTTPTELGGPPGDYALLQRYVNENPQKAFNAVNQPQNPNAVGYLEATGHPSLGNIFGDIMRLIGNKTINHPQTPARGPANFANVMRTMDPDVRSTILGDQLGNVADQVRLADALNISTSQAGLTRALGGQGDAVVNKAIGSETAAQIGGQAAGPIGAIIGRMLGVFGPSGYRSMKAGVLEGPTARNALGGMPNPGGIDQLAAALTAIQADQQQRRGPVVR